MEVNFKMLTADYIVLGLLLVFVLIGALVGFGKGLKFFTSGIFGIIISVFVCYLIFGLVLSWSVVSDLLARFNGWLREQGSVGTFFADIYIDRVVLAVVLFLIVQIVRMIIVKILKSIFEIDNIFVKVINKVVGAVFFAAVFVALLLFAFQIVSWIGGDTAANFLGYFDGSALLLDKLYLNNPLNAIFS